MANSSFNNILLTNDTAYVVLTIDGVEYRLRKSSDDPNTGSITKGGGSFAAITLDNNTLTVDGTSFILNSTSSAVSSVLSSFKIISAVNNGDGTISLTVDGNTIIVSDESITMANFILNGGGHLITDDGEIFKVIEQLAQLALANGDLLTTVNDEILQVH